MRKRELIFNVMVFAPLLTVPVFAASIGLFYRIPWIAFWMMTAFFLLGFVLFAKAKFSIIKQGQLFTFGPSKMSKSNRVTYVMGSGGMGIGLFLLICFSFFY